MKRIFFSTLIMLLITASYIQAGEPLAALKIEIDQAIDILSNPESQDPLKKKAQQDSLWEIGREITPSIY